MVLKISSKLRTTEKWSEKKTHNNDEKSNEKFFGWFVIVHSFTHTIENSNKTDDEVKSTEHLDLKRAMKIAIEKLDCFCKFLLQDDKNVNQFKCKTAKSRRKNKKHKKQKKKQAKQGKIVNELKTHLLFWGRLLVDALSFGIRQQASIARSPNLCVMYTYFSFWLLVVHFFHILFFVCMERMCVWESFFLQLKSVKRAKMMSRQKIRNIVIFANAIVAPLLFVVLFFFLLFAIVVRIVVQFNLFVSHFAGYCQWCWFVIISVHFTVQYTCIHSISFSFV